MDSGERSTDAVREVIERELRDARAEAEAVSADLSTLEGQLAPLRTRLSRAQGRIHQLRAALKAYDEAARKTRSRPKPRVQTDDVKLPAAPVRMPAGFIGQVFQALPLDGRAVTVDDIVGMLKERGVQGNRKNLLAALSVLTTRLKIASRPERGQYARIQSEINGTGTVTDVVWKEGDA